MLVSPEVGWSLAPGTPKLESRLLFDDGVHQQGDAEAISLTTDQGPVVCLEDNLVRVYQGFTDGGYKVYLLLVAPVVHTGEKVRDKLRPLYV